MWVNWKKPRQVSDGDASLLTALASQATVAIRAAKRYSVIQEKSSLNEAIHRVSMAANSTLDLKEIYRNVLAEMVRVFRVDQGGIVIFDHQKGYGYTEMEYPKVKKPNVPIPLKNNLAIEWIMSHKEPLSIEDVPNDPKLDCIRDALQKWGVQSTILIPLMVKNEIIGTIGLDAVKSSRKFSQEEQKLSQTMANQVASAIHNARSYENILKQRKQLEALYDAAKILAQNVGLDRQHLLDKILELAIFIIDSSGAKATLGTIQIVDEQTNEREYTNVHSHSKSSELLPKIGQRTSLDKTKVKNGKIGITGRAAVQKKAQLVPNVIEDEDYIRYSPNTKSELALPLLDDDRVIGILNVEGNKVGAFDNSDRKALKALADLAIIAIRKAQSQEEFNAIQTVNSTFWLLSRWAHKVRQKSYALGNDLNTLKKHLPIGLYDEF